MDLGRAPISFVRKLLVLVLLINCPSAWGDVFQG